MPDGGLPDRAGATIERILDDVESRAATHAIGPALLGVIMALAVIAGGVGSFVVVLAVLVRFFS
jgi:hypothetical protein